MKQITQTLDYLEPETLVKACWLYEMIMHIQSPGMFRTVYSSLFKDIRSWSATETSPALFEIQKNVQILERMAQIVSIFGLNLPFIM